MVYLCNGFHRHQFAPDCGLVGDNYDGALGLCQTRKRRQGTWEDAELVGAAHVIASILVDYPVSVKKYRAAGAVRCN